MIQRLDKLISSQSTVTRSETVRLIRRGEVMVDGKLCKDPATKVDADIAAVIVSGKPLNYQRFVYIMMNKPAGILCVSRDPNVKTVVDLLPPQQRRKGLFPAGRLDKDTVGLVILTDDGDYAHRMLSPKKAVVKRYRVCVDGPLSNQDVEAFREGIVLADGTVCRPAGLYILQSGKTSVAEVEISEGRYHQIKRMFGVRDRGVLSLKRLSIGSLSLDPDLAEGESRFLTNCEREKPFI